MHHHPHLCINLSTSSAIANELVNPGLSMPNKFTNPGNPSSILIMKSCTPRPAEPFGPSLGLCQMRGVKVKVPYASVISCKGITIDGGEVFGYCFVDFVEMGVVDFVICWICDPLNIWAKPDPTS